MRRHFVSTPPHIESKGKLQRALCRGPPTPFSGSRACCSLQPHLPHSALLARLPPPLSRAGGDLFSQTSGFCNSRTHAVGQTLRCPRLGHSRARLKEKGEQGSQTYTPTPRQRGLWLATHPRLRFVRPRAYKCLHRRLQHQRPTYTQTHTDTYKYTQRRRATTLLQSTVRSLACRHRNYWSFAHTSTQQVNQTHKHTHPLKETHHLLLRPHNVRVPGTALLRLPAAHLLLTRLCQQPAGRGPVLAASAVGLSSLLQAT